MEITVDKQKIFDLLANEELKLNLKSTVQTFTVLNMGTEEIRFRCDGESAATNSQDCYIVNSEVKGIEVYSKCCVNSISLISVSNSKIQLLL